MAIETEDLVDAVLAHHGEVDSVTRGELGVANDDFSSLVGNLQIHGHYVIHHLEQDIETRLDRIATVDGDVAVEDLLQDLDIRDQPAPFGDGALEQTSGVHLVGVLGTHQVHGDVRVDENHSLASP
jgi:hypothetical protein